MILCACYLNCPLDMLVDQAGAIIPIYFQRGCAGGILLVLLYSCSFEYGSLNFEIWWDIISAFLSLRRAITCK